MRALDRLHVAVRVRRGVWQAPCAAHEAIGLQAYECARYELVGLAYLRRTCALKLLREPAHVCDTLVHAWVGVARSPDERIKERNIRLSINEVCGTLHQ